MGIYECRILLLGVIFLFSEGLGCIPGSDSVYLSVPEASCTFRDKTTCSYHAMPDWQPTEGESFENHSSTPQVLLTAGQDDDFYMLFRSFNNTNASLTIASPTLPGGKYQITFWYASPGQQGLLEMETVTTHSTNKHWNSINTVQTSWTGENITVEESNNFTIAFNAYDDISVFFGLDNIEVCRASGPLTLQNGTVKYNDSTAELSCDHGYRLIGNTTLTWKSDSTTPVCQPVDVVYQNSSGDCSFAMNDSCAYTLDERWTIQERKYLLFGRITLLQGGQDDDFYALFDSTKRIGDTGNPMYSMSSLLFQEGAACLSFYYTIPASNSTLHVRTRVEDNSTSEVWNVTGRAIRTWTKVEGLVIWQMNKYFVDFAAKTSPNAIIGIDNIHLESLHCASGYNLNRSEIHGYCNKSRTGFPSCEAVDCGDFIAPKKGTVSTIATTYGATATVKCQAGYILNGSHTSQCGSDGRWSIMEQTCDLVDCGHFAAPQNGNVSTLATTYGSTATVICREGYILNGSRTSLCEKDGSWTQSGQTCDPVDCGSFPALHNGSVTATHTIQGSIATITCDTGYILSGRSTSTCDINGNWSSQNQSCTPVDCKPFSAPQNGYVLTTATTYGSNANVTCHKGYNLNGSSTSICGENGLWNTIDQTCEPVDCGDFAAPQNGTVETIATTYRSTATVTCQTGYILNGSRTSQCGSDGRWDIMGQACDPVDCGSFPALHNGSVTATNTILGSIATITCYTGYILNGSSTSMCDVNGFWSSQNQSCDPVDCKPFSAPHNGSVLTTATTYGSIATVTCHAGYNLIGSITSVCGENGLWSTINQTCETLACDLLNISNGHIIVDKSTAYFRCNEGYRLVGNSSATCTQWTWSSEAPSCELIDCGKPIAPSNGYVASNSTSYGSVSTVSCNIGYFVKGNYTGVCGNNQGWTNENTTCLSIDSTMLSAIIPGCSNHGWNIAVNLTFLRSSMPNYKTEMQIYLGNATCKGSERRGFLVYDNNFYECMTRKKVSANLNILENQMVLIFHSETSVASNAYNWTIDLHCNVVDKNIITSVSTNQLHSDANSICISVFIDPFFRMELPSNPLHAHIGDTVYVKVSSPIRDPEIKLLLKSCYIRPALEKDSRLDSALIQNGCEVESSINMISISAHEIQFMFQNYAPVALREGMNVICDVAYCNSQELTLDCNQTCNRMLAPVIVG